MRACSAFLLLLVACTAGADKSESDETSDTVDSAPPGQVWPLSAQLHLHGPMSEGDGTHHFQDQQARRWEVDALWWTDHAEMYHLGEGRCISEPGWDSLESASDLAVKDPQNGIGSNAEQWWSVWRDAGASLAYGLVDEAAPSGGRALELSMTSGDDALAPWATATWEANKAALFRPLLAHPKIRLSLFVPEDYNPKEHRVRVVVPMSRLDMAHPVRLVVHDTADPVSVAPSHDVEDSEDRSVLNHATTLHAVEWVAGGWNRVELDLAALFSDGELGLDLTAQGLSVELSARGETALTIRVAEISLSHVGDAAALLERQVEFLDAMSDEDLRHIVGQELVFAQMGHHHITAFTHEPVGLIPLEGDTQETAVTAIRARGGISALAHPFSIEVSVDPQADVEAEVAEVCAALVKNQAYGVDLLEAGYRERGLDLEAHLALWDCLSLAGLRLHGIGTSDLHNAIDWDAFKNNFVTWIWEAGPDRKELVPALASGRLFFGDPTVYQDIRLDLTQDGQSVMGQTLALPASLTPVLFGQNGDETARWVVDGEEVWSGPVAEIEMLELTQGVVARLEFRNAKGEGLLFSNAVWFE